MSARWAERSGQARGDSAAPPTGRAVRVHALGSALCCAARAPFTPAFLSRARDAGARYLLVMCCEVFALKTYEVAGRVCVRGAIGNARCAGRTRARAAPLWPEIIGAVPTRRTVRDPRAWQLILVRAVSPSQQVRTTQRYGRCSALPWSSAPSHGALPC